MNLKIRSRKIEENSVFQSHFALFRSFTTPGFNGGWIRGWKRNHLSFANHNSCLFYPVIHDSFIFFFRDSWFISHCFIQKAENDLKLYMLFCFAPCVKLMFWYKIALTLTNKRASKRGGTEIVFSVDSLTLTFAQSTCIRYQLSEQIIVYVAGQESLSCTCYIPLSSILEIFTSILHTCSIKNDPNSFFVGFAQWEIKHYCRKRPFLSAQVWAEGQHELLKMVRFDYLCINSQTFCVFKTMSVR